MNRLIKHVLFLFCMVQSIYLLYLLNNLNYKSSFINFAASDLRHKNERMLNLKLSILTLKGDQFGIHLDSINNLKKSISRLLKDKYFWSDEAYLAQKKVREMIYQTYPYLLKYDDSCFHGMWKHRILLDAPSNCIFFGTSGYSVSMLNSTDYENFTLFHNGKVVPMDYKKEISLPLLRNSKLRLVRKFVNFNTGQIEEQVDEREMGLDKLGM